jgi:hypothetical protein
LDLDGHFIVHNSRGLEWRNRQNIWSLIVVGFRESVATKIRKGSTVLETLHPASRRDCPVRRHRTRALDTTPPFFGDDVQIAVRAIPAQKVMMP